MAQPFHVSCSQHGVGLYELADGRFQLIEDGPIAPFMFGPGYMLIERTFAAYLKSLQLNRVIFESAVIWHRRANEEYRTHERILVGQWFSPDQINDLNLKGEKLLVMNDQYLFASPALALRLHDAPFPYIQLTEGLTEFAGTISTRLPSTLGSAT